MAKKYKIASASDAVHYLRMACYDFSWGTEDRIAAEVITDAVEWFTRTARSSYDFDRALCKADPRKLLRFCKEDARCSYSGIILRVKRYITRFCGYKED